MQLNHSVISFHLPYEIQPHLFYTEHQQCAQIIMFVCTYLKIFVKERLYFCSCTILKLNASHETYVQQDLGKL